MTPLTNHDILNWAEAWGLDFPDWIRGVEPDGDVGLGLRKIWLLPRSHHLFLAGAIHDLEYKVKHEKTSKNADARFLENCLRLSDRYWLKAQSYLFYSFARAYGIFGW